MSQICIARDPKDLHLLADAEKFLNAMRRNPEGSLSDVLGNAPGIKVLGAQGDGVRVENLPVQAIDILNAPTEVVILAGDNPTNSITLTPKAEPIDQLIAESLKATPSFGPGGARPSRGPKG